MHVEQLNLHQRNKLQGNFIILPTEVANSPTKTGSGGGVAPPHTHPPLAPGLREQYVLSNILLSRRNFKCKLVPS